MGICRCAYNYYCCWSYTVAVPATDGVQACDHRLALASGAHDKFSRPIQADHSERTRMRSPGLPARVPVYVPSAQLAVADCYCLGSFEHPLRFVGSISYVTSIRPLAECIQVH